MHMCMHMMCMHICMCMCRRSVVERREAEGGQTELVGFEMAVDINPLCCPPMRSHTDTHIYIAWSTLPYARWHDIAGSKALLYRMLYRTVCR